MALVKNKRNQYLLIFLVIIIIGIGFIWWKNSSTETSPEEEQISINKVIEINFDFLKNVPLDNFEPFSGVPEFMGEISPRNPFLPK
ncbi:MAG TPA: hypothetical protein PLL80_01755 [Candidatus Pacearchaeota archaeon]|nr:hypothetical protein [Candidatus Pacearchaeota archaeon]HOK94380.1 hypothetical protein [Candidatus Pacearchaeota archaeon]HPO75310.1 hypothetical protein [Candidatus Pacearchaeota archaeon]